MKILRFALAILSLVSCLASAAEIHFTSARMEIDAGSVGQFTIEYPALRNEQQQPVHKIQEKNTAETTATLKYEGGGQIDLALGEGGKVVMKLVHVPADVKSIGLETFIPIAFNQNGKWKIGDKEGGFPREKPANPHLFQGHSTDLKITNYENRSLSPKLPPFSFVELTDNREWNWPIFNFRSYTPINPDLRELAVTVTIDVGAAGAKSAPLVDELGQAARETWPDKVRDAGELKADVETEKAFYAGFHPPVLDPFGGLPGSQGKFGLQATGFFHVEKKGERWFLVDPAGNAFFHLGLCGVNPSEDYTLVKGRESAYAWLPSPTGEYASIFRQDNGGTILSFHLANMIRKYAEPYDSESYATRMIPRMRALGFNSNGAFSSGGEAARAAANFPSVASLPLSEWQGIPRLPQINEVFDPFDENVRAKIKETWGARCRPERRILCSSAISSSTNRFTKTSRTSCRR